MTVEIKNFDEVEFFCPCKYESCPKSGVQDTYLQAIQELRTRVGKPFYINSGYRCSEHNHHIGGVDNSYHVKGLAADVSIRGWGGLDKHTLLSQAFDLFNGVGIYKTFIHLDLRNRETKSCWITSF
jgi:uncharacterized protein YcbK (DUF882 family)